MKDPVEFSNFFELKDQSLAAKNLLFEMKDEVGEYN
jgi:hypothetical protein